MVKGVEAVIHGLKRTEIELRFGRRRDGKPLDLAQLVKDAEPEKRDALQASIDKFTRQLDLDLGLFTAESAEQVKQLIADGANPQRVFKNDHTRDIDHFNAIDLQVVIGNKQTVAALLEAGVPLSYRRLNGTGPTLKRALDRGNLDAAEAMVESGKISTEYLHLTLCSAIFAIGKDAGRALAIVDRLVAKAKKKDLNDCGYDPDDHSRVPQVYGSVLAAAIAMDRADVLEKLLKAGADPKIEAVADALAQNRNAKTLPAMVDVLFAHGFDPATKSDMGDELIIAAMAQGNRTLVQILKDKGVTVDVERLNQSKFDRHSHGRHFNLLDHAISRRNFAAVELLRENGASLDIAIGNDGGISQKFGNLVRKPETRLRNFVLNSAVNEFSGRTTDPMYAHIFGTFNDEGKSPYDILLNVHARNIYLLKAMGIEDKVHISFQDLKAAVAKAEPKIDLTPPAGSPAWATQVEDEGIGAQAVR